MKHKFLSIAFILSLSMSTFAKASEDFQLYSKQDLSEFLENKEPECKTRLFKIFEAGIRNFIREHKINEDPKKQLAFTMTVFAILYEFSDKIDEIIKNVIDLESRFSENESSYPEFLDSSNIRIFEGELWTDSSWNQFLNFVNLSAPWVHTDKEKTSFDLVFEDLRVAIKNHYLSPNAGEEDSSFQDLFYQAHDLTFHPGAGLRDDSDLNNSLMGQDLITALTVKMMRVSEYLVLDYLMYSPNTELLLDNVYERALHLLPSRLPDFVYPSWLIDFHNSILHGQGDFIEFQVYHSWLGAFYENINFLPFLKQRQISGSSYRRALVQTQKIKNIEETKSKEEEKEEEDSSSFKRKYPSEGGESSETASARKRVRTDENIHEEENLTEREKQVIDELIVDAIGRGGELNLDYAESHLSHFAFAFLLSNFWRRY